MEYMITGGSVTPNKMTRCESCDEGLYLYTYPNTKKFMFIPPEDGGPNIYNFTMNVCVPDCSRYNAQTVNNPLTGRCSYLGVYCEYGTYQEGCL